MKSKSRFSVWIVVGLLSATGLAGAEQDPGANGLADVDAVEGEIAENLARVEHAQTRQAQIDTEISGLADKREEAEERLHERARGLYRIRRAGMLPIAGGFDALMGHLARVQRLSRMVKGDLDTMDFLGERGAALRVERNQLTDALQEAQIALRALEAKKEEIEHSRRSASLFEETLRGEREDLPSHSVSYGRIRVSGDMDDLGDGFAQMRGQLALPVQGSMRIGESSREGAAGLCVQQRTDE
ncbi:MAG: hypothetical protein JRF54_14455 [Deltaproteobacteria bacterium]|nr:hypothetical protein [Deltaproteobacteria bacterium]